MATVAMVSSASALLAMLNKNHPVLKLHALSNLNTFADYFWPEISTNVPTMLCLNFIPLVNSLLSINGCKVGVENYMNSVSPISTPIYPEPNPLQQNRLEECERRL